MPKEIKALPDKEFDLDLNFEVREQSKRQPYKMRSVGYEIPLHCFIGKAPKQMADSCEEFTKTRIFSSNIEEVV